jgi:CBS domain-containing protein
MGEHDVRAALEGEQLRVFMKHVLDDLRAFEVMMAMGLFEEDVARIGAEQELFLVDRYYRPAPVALDLLPLLQDPHYTTEIAAFNLEINLDPLELGGDCFGRLQAQTSNLVEKIRSVGAAIGVMPVLIGILPTVRKSDIELCNMTDVPRYHVLNEALTRQRGGPYEFHIKGVDELTIKHDNVLIEGCNCSFQVHLQVGLSDFAKTYNVAQLLTAPVLAAATNSPLLFGRRLWRETRIALFQQAVDTRGAHDSIRERSPRVTFGSSWVQGTPLELYRDDISRFRVLIGSPIDEDPFEMLRHGIVPELKALRLYNGTIYRWNRVCYGTMNGRAHIRIENRVLPSGPTILDEVANAAFWVGLMRAAPEEYGDVTTRIAFDDTRMNFVVAARLGLDSHFTWLDGERISAEALLCERLLPLARRGLESSGVAAGDVDKYLGVIEERVRSGRTGSRWVVDSFDSMKGASRAGARVNALVAATVEQQAGPDAAPVAKWEMAKLGESGDWVRSFSRVEHYMTTDLFTVREDEPIELVANIMDWRNIRHVPVEDSQNRLVGIVSYRTILRLIGSGPPVGGGVPVAVGKLMKPDPVWITPETSTLEAIALMRSQRVSALPVVKEGRLVGIVSERDFLEITRKLLEEKLEEDGLQVSGGGEG